MNVQLSDAVTGTGLWAETFDRDLGSKDVFDLQDELTDRIVATVADTNGVLAGSMGALVRAKPVASLSAYEWVLQYFAYMREVTPSAHQRTREALERAVEAEPHYASAWACLSSIYMDEHRFGFNPSEESLDRALAAARRSVRIDPTISLAHLVLSWISYLRRDLAAFRSSAERTLASNPRDAAALCQLGILTSYAGEWEKGLAMSRRAREFNAQHPGWYYFSTFYDHYRKREYEPALVRRAEDQHAGAFSLSRRRRRRGGPAGPKRGSERRRSRAPRGVPGLRGEGALGDGRCGRRLQYHAETNFVLRTGGGYNGSSSGFPRAR